MNPALFLGRSLDLPFSARFTHLHAPFVLILFLAGALFIVVTAQSLHGALPPPRRWIALGLRLALLLILVLALAGLEIQRRNQRLDVVALCDVSPSTGYVRQHPPPNLQGALDKWFANLSADPSRPPADSFGEITFDDRAFIDLLPSQKQAVFNRSFRQPGQGTDPAYAINLALAAFEPDAMRRIVLVWDGNKTTGDIDSAVNAAASLHVPIDVVPLNYSVKDAVVFQKLVAPARRRAGEPFSLDAVIRNTADRPVTGTLIVDSGAQVLASQHITLMPGLNARRVPVSPSIGVGLRRFHARFDPDQTLNFIDSRSLDQLRSAGSFTYIAGKSRVLYVDASQRPDGQVLADALLQNGISPDTLNHISPDQFPDSIADLEQYDAVILSNVPRGQGGLTDSQANLLARYVQDTAGGLLVIGGPNALGAGGWIGSPLEKILPVDCSVPATRSLPAGALILVIDHSGSMSETVPGSSANKQRLANEAAILALQTMTSSDYFGVIAFDSAPTWVVPLGPNKDATSAAQRIREIRPAGGTDICPALDAAERAISQITTAQAAIRHVILLTDGDSQDGDYDAVTRRMSQNHITLSTIGVGSDVNANLLDRLARQANGSFYPVTDPNILPRLFIREASILRRPLIHEDPRGLQVNADVSATVSAGPHSLLGMVLTTAKPSPAVEVPLTAGPSRDPLLAQWRVGLGKVAVFTADAGTRWSPQFVAHPSFGKFWTQLLRGVQRAPGDAASNVELTVSGKRAHLRVELTDTDNSPANITAISGALIDPDPTSNSHPIPLIQQGPGEFTSDFDVPSGENIIALNYRGPGVSGVAVAGVDVQSSEELRALNSNADAVVSIAARTGGRVLKPFDPDADLFTRDGLWPSFSRQPLTPALLVLAMCAFLLDVANRRIAWDRHSFSQALTFIREFTQSHFASPHPVPLAMTAALARAKSAVAQRTADAANLNPPPQHAAPASNPAQLSHPTAPPHPDPSPPPHQPTNTPDRFNSLLQAKRRAQSRRPSDPS